ncbi:pentapeptide MXKDX repeat protein [Paraburkholderia sp. GAS42]|jgi:pentapeptide MXKDX repeat protein|uniref:pentapeptide MXKDX repeat protein n=1 Tax=Paraburkholderia sp. GAS42 TaxID=3035135 RepID=UPI003D1EE912
MKKPAIAAIAALAVMFLAGGTPAFAQEASGAMSNGAMSHDSMSKDSMSKDSMSKDSMSKDKMSHSKMKKGSGSTGMKHEASGAMAN